MIPLKILRTAFVLVPALAALVAAPALAQVSSPQAAPSTATGTEAPQAVDEVVVRGRRLSEIESDLRIYIDKFLDEVAAPARGRPMRSPRPSRCEPLSRGTGPLSR